MWDKPNTFTYKGGENKGDDQPQGEEAGHGAYVLKRHVVDRPVGLHRARSTFAATFRRSEGREMQRGFKEQVWTRKDQDVV